MPGKRLRKNVKLAYEEVVTGRRGVETAVSYMGHLKHMNSKTVLEEAFSRVGWEYKV